MTSGQITVWIILAVVLVLMMSFLYQRGLFTQRQEAALSKVNQQSDVRAVSSLVQTVEFCIGGQISSYTWQTTAISIVDRLPEAKRLVPPVLFGEALH